MNSLILIGASTRAAAASARQAGWAPWCADLFADADLEAIAPVRKVPRERYPEGLLEALREAPPGPIQYTGALENWPDLLARLASFDRPLWGNPPAVLRAVRDPQRWCQAVRDAGLPCPALADTPPTRGRWLVKPRKGASGLGIQVHDGQPVDSRTHYVQEWIDGLPCSAVYAGIERRAILLGVTRQLIGVPWLNVGGFQYAGSVGPLDVDTTPWRALGAVLAEAFDLRGLFGVDAVLKDGVPWPVEINPRTTASVEVLERSRGASLFPAHRAAFVPGVEWDLRAVPAPGAKWGKAILFARRAFVFPHAGPGPALLAEGASLDGIAFADLPHAGERIEPGWPVLTILAPGASPDACLGRLQETARALDRRWWG